MVETGNGDGTGSPDVVVSWIPKLLCLFFLQLIYLLGVLLLAGTGNMKYLLSRNHVFNVIVLRRRPLQSGLSTATYGLHLICCL